MNRNSILSLASGLAILTSLWALGCSDGGGSSGSSTSSSSSGGGEGGVGGHGGAGGAGGNGGAGGGGASCADRPGGALITFDIAGQSLTLWITNQAFIAEAQMLLQTGMTRVPVFNQVIDGQDCDPVYTFHVDPEMVSFADATIELCDGTPEYLEMDTPTWIAQVKQYCPWSAIVKKVDVHP